jgi:hypothetical protein
MSTEIVKHKNYTPAELYNMFGVDWRFKLGLKSIPKIFNKPVISKFEDFDEDTKTKYIEVAKCIKQANPNESVQVWATGSRIHGCWRTDEEAEQLAKEYNHKRPKYSDYDFITDAKIIPDLKHLGFRVHEYQTPYIQHKVLVPTV